jgi:hypothetical protein
VTPLRFPSGKTREDPSGQTPAIDHNPMSATYDDTPLVRVRDILVNECWVTCPTCGYVNFHTVGPSGAPIADRRWGHRVCESPGFLCDGYCIVPAENVQVHAELASFKKTGAIPKGWQQANMKMHTAAP